MATQAVKVDHVDAALPCRDDARVRLGNIEMAEIQILVKEVALVEKARQPSQLARQAGFPLAERRRCQLPKSLGNRLVQADHALEFLDGEEALQLAEWLQILSRGDDLRNR